MYLLTHKWITAVYYKCSESFYIKKSHSTLIPFSSKPRNSDQNSVPHKVCSCA